MTEEIKTETVEKEIEKKEKKECCCKCLKKFLLTALASFFGCLVALCLYGAATKPQLPPPPPMMGPSPQMQMPFEHGKFNRHQKAPFEMRGKQFEKKFEKKFEKRGEFKGEKMRKEFDGAPGPQGQRPSFDDDED